MIRPLLSKVCRSEYYISSDISPTNQTTLVCDSLQLPFDNKTLDLIAAFEVMEHIHDTKKFFSEIVRVLKPDGYVVISAPFIYGKHDFQDYYRWTEQGLDTVLKTYGFSRCLMRPRGGTFFSINSLIQNYLITLLSSRSEKWRSHNLGKNFFLGVMQILMSPLVISSWFFLGLDTLIDHNSSNPSGFVCIAKKNKK